MPRPFSWSGDLLDQPNSFAPPIAHAGHRHLRNFTRTFTRIARPRRREQLALAQGFARDREIGEKLRIEAMTNMGTGGAYRKADFLQRVFFFRGRRLEARGARNDDSLAALDLGFDGGPFARDRSFDFAGLPPVAVGLDRGDPREWRGTTFLSVLLAFDHERGTHRGERDAAMPAAVPHRGELVLQKVPGKLGDEQEIPARAVKGAADQGYVALARGDALEGEPHRVDARRFLAHEGARGADDAVDDRDVAGEQIRQLR